MTKRYVSSDIHTVTFSASKVIRTYPYFFDVHMGAFICNEIIYNDQGRVGQPQYNRVECITCTSIDRSSILLILR